MTCALDKEKAALDRERKGDWRIRRFWTANANPEDRPWGLGRLGLPDRLPFSDCQVKAILQGDAKTMRKGNPLAELADGVFEYSSCHVTCGGNRQTWRIHYTLFAVAA